MLHSDKKNIVEMNFNKIIEYHKDKARIEKPL